MSRSVLFVYGTLKRGFSNHGQMQGARFLGAVETRPVYTLRHLGSYPALTPGGTTPISGELYEVTVAHFARLDEFEGPPYERITVALSDGTEAIAYGISVEDGVPYPVVADGVWTER